MKFFLISIFLLGAEVQVPSTPNISTILDQMPTLMEKNEYLKHLQELLTFLHSPSAKKNPRYGEILYYLGYIYFKEKLPYKAEEMLLKCVNENISPDLKNKALMKLASLYSFQGLIKKSVEVYREVKDPMRGDWLDLYYVSKALIKMRMFSEALKLLKKVKELTELERSEKTFYSFSEVEAFKHKVYYLEGVAYAGVGKTDLAIQSFLKAREAIPTRYFNDLVNLQIARIKAERGLYEDALKEYESIRDEKLQDEAKIEIAWIYFRTGRFKEALDVISQIEKNTSNPSYLLEAKILHGYILLKQGDGEASLTYLSEMLKEYEKVIKLMDEIISQIITSNKEGDISSFISDIMKGNYSIYYNVLNETPSMKNFYSIKNESLNLFSRLDSLFSHIISLEGKIIEEVNKTVKQNTHFANSIREKLMEIKLLPIVEKVSYEERNLYERLNNYRREILFLDADLRKLMDKVYSKINELESRMSGGEVQEQLILKYNIYAEIGSKCLQLNTSMRELLEESLDKMDIILSLYSIKYNIKDDPRMKKVQELIEEIDRIKRELYQLWEGFNTRVVIEMEKIKSLAGDYRRNAKFISSSISEKQHLFQTKALLELKSMIVDELGKVELAYTEAGWVKKTIVTKKIEDIYSSLDELQKKEETKFNKTKENLKTLREEKVKIHISEIENSRETKDLIFHLDEVQKSTDEIINLLRGL